MSNGEGFNVGNPSDVDIPCKAAGKDTYQVEAAFVAKNRQKVVLQTLSVKIGTGQVYLDISVGYVDILRRDIECASTECDAAAASAVELEGIDAPPSLIVRCGQVTRYAERVEAAAAALGVCTVDVI